MKEKKEYKRLLLYLAIMFVLGVVYYIPRLFRADFPYCYPEDAEFHLNRLIGLDNVWVSPVNYNTTRVSNYSTTYYNNTGYGTITSSTTSSSYTMGSAYQTSYAATDIYGTETSIWINLISEVTDSNGNIATSWAAGYSSEWDRFTTFTGYQNYTKLSNNRIASTSGNYQGYYVINR